jgi:hypothetical protein
MAGFLFLSLWAAAAAGQTAAPTVYKCVDERRQVTYTNTVCEKQGLRDAGPIADRTTSMPFTAPPKPASPRDSAKPPAATDESGRSGAQVKPASPLIDKLLK